MESPSACHAAHAAAKGKEMPQFAAVLAQLNYDNMAPLASDIRQSIETISHEKFSPTNLAPWHGCSISPEPLNGSYNLAYLVQFEDGAQWIFKIPANGYHACFDGLAAQALTSEALTMRLIKQTTTIPLPTVYHFDASFKNDIGCPYILMDFLKGKPLWEGWFDKESSRSSVEQFRARSMQTIAAAMVQLSQFTVDSGGFLQFDRDGQPVGVTAARVPDWLAGSDMQQGLTTTREGCLYCEKAPIKDPAASFLFMLDRRGVREGDGPLELGSHEIVRMFTEWTLEKAENANDRRRKFVLAHPDFAVQNFLVEDDGTLCGIIDWDGVAAVPLSIGCLKYPDWLMSDWHPLYNYCPGVVGQQVDSREDLATYRTMYAQFVEASSTVVCGSSRAGKLNADITRRSLIAGSLDVGAQDPELTNAMIGIIFQKLESLTADDDDGEMFDTGLGSSIGTSTNDMNEDSGGENASTETEDSIRIDEKDDHVKSPCSKSPADLAPQLLSTNFDDVRDASRPPISHTTRFDGPSSKMKHVITFPSGVICIEKKDRDKKASGSRKAKLTKWALSLGEKGSKMIVDSLHKNQPIKLEPCRKVRAVKWALDMGEKCCKGASQAFHKKQGPSDLHSKDGPKPLTVQNGPQPTSRAVNLAAGTSERIATLQSSVATRMHPDSVPSNEESKSEQTMTQRIQDWVNWLIAVFKNIILKRIDDHVGGVEKPATTGRRVSPNLFLQNEGHFQGCNPCSENSRGRDGMRSTCIHSQDVWASIGAEIDEGGIPIDLVKKHRDVIVECVIRTLGNEFQREKGTNSHISTEKTAAQGKQATITSTNKASTPDLHLCPAVLGSNLTSFDPKMATHAESFIASEGATSERVCLNRNRDEYESPKPESLISKLEAAMRRFDLESRLKGKQSESPTPQSEKCGEVVGRFQIPKLQEAAHDLTTLESIEEANRKLRTMLSSFATPRAPGTNLCSKPIQAMGAYRATIEQLDHAKAERFGDDFGTSESDSQKLRNTLSSLKRPEAVTTDRRKEIIQVAGDVDGFCKSRDQSQMLAMKQKVNAGSNVVSVHNPNKFHSGQWCETSKGIVAVQTPTNVKRDWCFETAGGSLKRVQTQETLHGKVYDQESSLSSQLAISGRQVFKAVNVFQVPDDDDDFSGYVTGGSTNDKIDREDGRLEDGEIDEELSGCVDNEAKSEIKGPTTRCSNEDKVKHERKVENDDDTGNFNPYDVCVALGKGKLDERRMRRLREGFMALLDDSVGRYRRKTWGASSCR